MRREDASLELTDPAFQEVQWCVKLNAAGEKAGHRLYFILNDDRLIVIILFF